MVTPYICGFLQLAFLPVSEYQASCQNVAFLPGQDITCQNYCPKHNLIYFNLHLQTIDTIKSWCRWEFLIVSCVSAVRTFKADISVRKAHLYSFMPDLLTIRCTSACLLHNCNIIDAFLFHLPKFVTFGTNSCPFPWHLRLVDRYIKPLRSFKWNLVASALLQQTFCTSTHQLHALKFKSTTFSSLELILHCTMWRIAHFFGLLFFEDKEAYCS